MHNSSSRPLATSIASFINTETTLSSFLVLTALWMFNSHNAHGLFRVVSRMSIEMSTKLQELPRLAKPELLAGTVRPTRSLQTASQPNDTDPSAP
jgi:hypothetical protein